jgi:hypothetical protein
MMHDMKRVTGIGGIFFKSRDSEKLREWYRAHPGIESEGESGASFHWREAQGAKRRRNDRLVRVPRHDKIFRAGRGPIHDQLSRGGSRLAAAAVARRRSGVDPRVEEYEYGRFAWIMDPEGNRIELREPPAPAK